MLFIILSRSDKAMKKEQKMVENFQYDESKGFTEDGVDVYVATHIVSKELFLLKKVNLRGNAERAKQKNLINQVNNLKLMSDPTIAECHKMLKTTNNIYLVYDYCDGTTLEELIENKDSLSEAKKEAIARQIIQALKVMANANIVHSNLTPKSIIVTNDNKIKIMNFVYSHNMQSYKEMPIKFKPPASKYTALEINDGVVNRTSDLYSLGVILDEMNLQLLNNQEKSGSSKNSSLTMKLLFNKPNDRPSFQEIASVFTPVLGKKPSMDTLIVKSTSQLRLKTEDIKKAKSMNEKEELGQAISPRGGTDLSEIRDMEKKFTELVLKRRNFAIFLLQLAEVCMTLEDDENRLGLLIGYLLFKKSTQVITALLGYLKNQSGYENQIEAGISANQRKLFEKKPDFFRLVSTINKECSSQRRMLEDLQKSIVPELNPQLQELTKNSELDNKSLGKYIVAYLKYIITEEPPEITNKIAARLYFMSEIIQYKSFEKMFDELINEEKISLQEQSIFTHVNSQEKKQLLQQITTRLKQC